MNAARKKKSAAAKPVRKSVMPIRKILVPIDFSTCSMKALDYALAMARQFNATLVLGHVVQFDYPAIDGFGGVDFGSLEVDLMKEAEEQLKKITLAVRKQGVSVRNVVTTGRAAAGICDLANDQGADLIVVSTHGYTNLKHFLLGSVSEGVVRHASCPVLVVREHEREFVI